MRFPAYYVVHESAPDGHMGKKRFETVYEHIAVDYARAVNSREKRGSARNPILAIDMIVRGHK